MSWAWQHGFSSLWLLKGLKFLRRVFAEVSWRWEMKQIYHTMSIFYTVCATKSTRCRRRWMYWTKIENDAAGWKEERKTSEKLHGCGEGGRAAVTEEGARCRLWWRPPWWPPMRAAKTRQRTVCELQLHFYIKKGGIGSEWNFRKQNSVKCLYFLWKVTNFWVIGIFLYH